jgi:ubiquinone/menaquinone biosynthesis C-methylase UbiE
LRFASAGQNRAFADSAQTFADSRFVLFSIVATLVTDEEVLMSAQTLAAKPYKGWGMEGAVARWYAGMTRKSMGEFANLARRVAEQIPHRAKVLEVAPGPGYFAIELAKIGEYQITGLDISKTFVEIAREHARKAGVSVDFQQGNAARMPFVDESFDFLLCRAAFKNFTEPQRALDEMFRVLTPGGNALIIDLRRDASMDSIREAACGMNAGAVNRVITKITFRYMLLKRAYTKCEFQQMIGETKFHQVQINENPIGLEILLSKPGKDFLNWSYFTLNGARTLPGSVDTAGGKH